MQQKSAKSSKICAECEVNSTIADPKDLVEIEVEFDRILEQHGDFEMLYKKELKKNAQLGKQLEDLQRGKSHQKDLRNELDNLNRKNQEICEKLKATEIENTILKNKLKAKSISQSNLHNQVNVQQNGQNQRSDLITENVRLKKENQSLNTLNRNLKAQLNSLSSQGIENEKPSFKANGFHNGVSNGLERRSRSVSDDLLCNNYNHKNAKDSQIRKSQRPNLSLVKMENGTKYTGSGSSEREYQSLNYQNSTSSGSGEDELDFNLLPLPPKPKLIRSNSVKEMIKIFEEEAKKVDRKPSQSFRIGVKGQAPLKIQNINNITVDEFEV